MARTRHLLVLSVCLLLIPLGAASADAWEDARLRSLEYLEELRATEQVPGIACMVLVDGDVVMGEALGVADRESETPMTLDTRTQVGSLTKSFVAAAALLAAERGQLDLDVPLATLLDDIPDAWSGLTVRHLLNHTGGVVDYTEFPDIRERYRLETPHEEIVAEMRSHELSFAPGAQWSYSNSGYHFVGLALETSTGNSLGDLLEESLFAPAGMESASLLTADGCADCATGYVVEDGALAPGPHNSSTWSYAAGGVVASARDLAAWIRALAEGSPVPPALLRQMWTPAVDASGEKAPYGLGTQLQTGPGFTLAYHTGSRPGFHATMGTLVERRLSVIVLLNRSDVDSFPIAQRLAYEYGQAMQAEEAP